MFLNCFFSAPNCSPRLTHIFPTTSTSIRIYWKILQTSSKRLNGLLRGYKLAYRLSRTGSRLRYINVTNPSTTSVVVRGLDKYTRYIFHVLAYTIKDGPLSNALEAATRQDGIYVYTVRVV